jgi:hypothetical protein
MRQGGRRRSNIPVIPGSLEKPGNRSLSFLSGIHFYNGLIRKEAVQNTGADLFFEKDKTSAKRRPVTDAGKPFEENRIKIIKRHFDPVLMVKKIHKIHKYLSL